MKIWIDGKEEDAILLHIKSKWFQMILAGEKTEEYRKISQYYRSRFRNAGMLNISGEKTTNNQKYVLFQNGYSMEDPCFVAKCTLEIGRGIPDWGAEQNETYFKLIIHEVFHQERIKRTKVKRE